MKTIMRPPFGQQAPGGAGNKPALVYPDDSWQWPDLRADLRAALTVQNGKTAQSGGKGTAGDGRADGLTVQSADGELGGVWCKGPGRYVVEDSAFDLCGNGRNDFLAVGAGALADEGGELVLRGCRITTEGVVRPCTAATRGGVLKVYDCVLEAKGGTLPEGYTFRPGPGMLVPPPALGIGGTCRAHLSMDNSKTYFYDTTVAADGWGALSTDAANGDVYLEANRCKLTVRGPGYGAYADGECRLALNGCRIETATHGLIMAGVSEVKLRDCSIRSGKYFAMIHNVMGVPTEIAELTVDGGDLSTGRECLLLKSANTYVCFTGAKLSSDCGVLVRAVKNDDECATPVGDAPVFGNNVVFADMSVRGDVCNDDPERCLGLTLSGTKLRGGLLNVCLAMDGGSRFLADKDSFVTLEGEVFPGQLDALPGVTVCVCGGEARGLKSGPLPGGGVLLAQ